MFAISHKAKGFKSRIKVGRSAVQSIPYDTWTKLQFNYEWYDNLSEFDSVTNYKFTASQTGLYIVSSCVQLDSLVDTEKVEIGIKLNDTTLICRGTVYASEAGQVVVNCGCDYPLTANDTLHVEIYHNKGAGKNTGVYHVCQFCVHRFA